MILIDTSVWVDHLRQPNDNLLDILEDGRAVTHDFVIGELAVGSLKDRALFLHRLSFLPKTALASDEEVSTLIEARSLFARGISYVDAHLLASLLLEDTTLLWTFDRRLNAVAKEVGVSANLPGKLPN